MELYKKKRKLHIRYIYVCVCVLYMSSSVSCGLRVSYSSYNNTTNMMDSQGVHDYCNGGRADSENIKRFIKDCISRNLYILSLYI